MTILVSNDRHLNHIVKHSLKDIVMIISNIYDCQTSLSDPDMDCSILILDANLFDNEIFDAFINWILKKNLPIHNILVYNTENKSYITKGVRRLNKNKYKTQVIKLEQLLKSLE